MIHILSVSSYYPPRFHKMSSNKFILCRYQILPVDREYNGDFFDGINSIEELIQQKNNILEQVFDIPKVISQSQVEIACSLVATEPASMLRLYQMAARKKKKLGTENFQDVEAPDWQRFKVAIWNDPERQIVAIEVNKGAFNKSRSVMNKMVGVWNGALKKRHLRIEWEPIFDTNDFWSLVNSNKMNIKSLDFEFVTPNMARLYQGLDKEITDFSKRANSVRNTLSLQAAPGGHLQLDQTDPEIDGIVEASGKGAGSIAIKLKGSNKKLRTGDVETEISVDSIDIEGASEDALKALKIIMDQ